MRASVVAVDVCLLIPAVLLFSRLVMRKSSALKQVMLEAALLMQPSLLLIDHGHFQYNNASLGLCLLGIVSVCCDKDVLGSVLFSLALNYKQMELYHALPFFCFLLGKSLKKESW
jgi:alpha-1,3-glucosyltransferase